MHEPQTLLTYYWDQVEVYQFFKDLADRTSELFWMPASPPGTDSDVSDLIGTFNSRYPYPPHISVEFRTRPASGTALPDSTLQTFYDTGYYATRHTSANVSDPSSAQDQQNPTSHFNWYAMSSGTMLLPPPVPVARSYNSSFAQQYPAATAQLSSFDAQQQSGGVAPVEITTARSVGLYADQVGLAPGERSYDRPRAAPFYERNQHYFQRQAIPHPGASGSVNPTMLMNVSQELGDSTGWNQVLADVQDSEKCYGHQQLLDMGNLRDHATLLHTAGKCMVCHLRFEKSHNPRDRISPKDLRPAQAHLSANLFTVLVKVPTSRRFSLILRGAKFQSFQFASNSEEYLF
ncbi:hypothetical protein BJ508DRAFT_314535 [Ascobolus immersus RN42]|uniref:Uncharacterized protein n=1 Tax=Ascobolus immersus RN42 TaxID=1160509 RepID=A0A3N4HI25_ASCIM|nr:hypothetical protein BJ508DRAFT_314535 [Ascobolus immersus RN42]